MDGSILLGMTAGAAVMFGFGIVWLWIGLRGRSSTRWLRLALLIAGLALGSSIATLGVRASSVRGNGTTPTPQQIDANRRIALHFYVISGIEFAAIVLAVSALNAIHHPDFILSGIALIVGVHFFSLAALFRAPVYYGTALAGCAIGLAGFFIADTALRRRVVGTAFGLLLWGTAAWIAVQGLSSAFGAD
jgi:hypothetical protein